MIIPLPFIVSLLFTISYATDFKYEIEFDRCSIDTTCFIKKNCKTVHKDKPAAATILTVFKDTKDKLEGEKCDVVVQIKAFNEEKYLVLMQITAETAVLDETKGIAIKHNNFEQMACKKDGDNVVYNAEKQKNPDNPDEDIAYLILEGTNSEFGKTKMLCSFFASSQKETKSISDYFKDATSFDNVPSLIYSNGADVELTFDGGKKQAFWNYPFGDITCTLTPDGMWSSPFPHETYILEEADISRSPITCPGNKMIMKTQDEEVPIDQVSCYEKKWSKGPTNTEEDEGKQLVDKVTIACIKAEYCSACTPLAEFKPEECPTCTSLKQVDVEKCKVLKCTGEGETVTTDGLKGGIILGDRGIFCRKKSEGESEWASSETDEHKAVTKASCFPLQGCPPLTMFDCPEGVECKAEPKLDETHSNYSCPDADAVLHQDKEKVSLSCADHKWSGIDTSKSLYCAVEEKKGTAAKEEPNTGGIGPIVGGVFGGLILVGVIAGGLFYFLVYKKKKDAKKTTKKEEGTSKKSSKKSGGVGSSDEGTAKKDKDTKKESASEPNKESEKPAAGAEPPKEPAKDGKEPPKDGKEPPKDGKDATPAGAPSPAPPTTPATGTAPGTPAEAPAPAPIPPDATAV